MRRFCLADIICCLAGGLYLLPILCLLSLTGCSANTKSSSAGSGARSESLANPTAKEQPLRLMKFHPGSIQPDSSDKDKSYKQSSDIIKDKETGLPGIREAINKPLSPEKTEELLSEVGDNWVFGQGLGETAVTVGAIVAFPPYALVVAGNAALQLSGEEPVGVSDVLPEKGAEVWEKAYDGVTSVPGQTTSLLAGEKFRDKDIARERILAVLNK